MIIIILGIVISIILIIAKGVMGFLDETDLKDRLIYSFNQMGEGFLIAICIMAVSIATPTIIGCIAHYECDKNEVIVSTQTITPFNTNSNSSKQIYVGTTHVGRATAYYYVVKQEDRLEMIKTNTNNTAIKIDNSAYVEEIN